MEVSKRVFFVCSTTLFWLLAGCAAPTSDESEDGSGDAETGEVSEASASGCNSFALTADYAGAVCTGVSGSGLHTSSISGTYSGNYACTYLDLYINGNRVESKNFCASYFPHTFNTGKDHNWPGKTSVKVCARFINFVGEYCGPTFYIHA